MTYYWNAFYVCPVFSPFLYVFFVCVRVWIVQYFTQMKMKNETHSTKSGKLAIQFLYLQKYQWTQTTHLSLYIYFNFCCVHANCPATSPKVSRWRRKSPESCTAGFSLIGGAVIKDQYLSTKAAKKTTILSAQFVLRSATRILNHIGKN